MMISDVGDIHTDDAGALTYNVNEIQELNTFQRLEMKEGLESFLEILKLDVEHCSKDDLLVGDAVDDAAVVDNNLQSIQEYVEECTG